MNINVIVPIASVVTLYAVRMKELATKRNTIAGEVKETLTLRLFMLAGVVMMAASITEFLLRRSSLIPETFIAGWLCALASFVIRRRAIAALGRFWSLHVEIRAEHQFVRSGPFRWVRHPTYFSMILEMLAAGLILNATVSLGLAALIFIPTLLRRIQLEEAALVEKFGAAYQAYQRQTPALLPYKCPPTTT